MVFNFFGFVFSLSACPQRQAVELRSETKSAERAGAGNNLGFGKEPTIEGGGFYNAIADGGGGGGNRMRMQVLEECEIRGEVFRR